MTRRTNPIVGFMDDSAASPLERATGVRACHDARRLHQRPRLSRAPESARAPESSRRLSRILEHLDESGLIGRLTNIPVAPADRETLLAVHDAAYLDELARPGERYLDPDTYLSSRSHEAALAAPAPSAAPSMPAAGLVSRAFCAVRPPGHHAEPNRGMGFCLINNAAVAARHAQRVGYARVMIADFDVHHGNGTRPPSTTTTRSFTSAPTSTPTTPEPGRHRSAARGRGSASRTTSRCGPVPAMPRCATPITARSARTSPRSVRIAASSPRIRPARGDPLADLSVSDEGVRAVVRDILEACAGIPVVFTLEGGYHLQTLARCVGITVEELLH